MEVYYELVLDVSSLKEFSKDKDGNYTITVTDTLPNGLTFKEGSATGLIGASRMDMAISPSMIRTILKSPALVRTLLLSSKTSTTGASNMNLPKWKASD